MIVSRLKYIAIGIALGGIPFIALAIMCWPIARYSLSEHACDGIALGMMAFAPFFIIGPTIFAPIAVILAVIEVAIAALRPR